MGGNRGRDVLRDQAIQRYNELKGSFLEHTAAAPWPPCVRRRTEPDAAVERRVRAWLNEVARDPRRRPRGLAATRPMLHLRHWYRGAIVDLLMRRRGLSVAAAYARARALLHDQGRDLTIRALEKARRAHKGGLDPFLEDILWTDEFNRRAFHPTGEPDDPDLAPELQVFAALLFNEASG